MAKLNKITIDKAKQTHVFCINETAVYKVAFTLQQQTKRSDIMKKMRKIMAMLLAMMMVAGFSLTTFAANITLNGGAEGSQYSAWKLLSATDLGEVEGEQKYAYEVNETYQAILQGITGKTTDADIIDYINNLDDEGIRDFADAVYEEIVAANITGVASTGNSFAGVEQGYYLIAETKVGNAQDTYSLVMLDTAGNESVTVNTKEDLPTLEKKIKETNDSTGFVSEWQDGADYDFTDAVPFKLTGTVSSKYDDYKEYYYVFHDKMCDGLSFDSSSVVVKVDGKKVTGGYRVETENLGDDCTFEVVFPNLKSITGATVTADSVITVEFEATLNENAVVGKPGNPNEAKLEYSNNPYHTEDSEGDEDDDTDEDETSETPWDKVIAFTYKLNADKIDGTGAALSGAGFTLYKYDAKTGAYVAVGNEITGVTTFTFTGLDAGLYKLVETTVPAGYNQAADLEFEIVATYDVDSADPQLITLVVNDAAGNLISEGEEAVFNTVVTDGAVNTAVRNLQGTELPSTGGIGTTIFYVLGTVLMLGAVVVLVSRRRMNAE